MRVFKKLVQQKRKKMLFLTFLLFLFPFINVSGTINLTYILKKDKNELQPSCIAEEQERYAAVGWVYPILPTDQGIPNITTKFIPTIHNDYNCKFSKNDLCNKKWSIKNWNIDENSTRTRDFLADNRWEDLPTKLITKNTKEFSDRIQIEGVSSFGFSVRALGMVELLICTGWKPYDYPCYYFNIDNRDIYFNKYTSLPKALNDEYKTTNLESYKAYSNILSHDEWRNFVIGLNEKSGTIKLTDVNLNRVVIEHVDKDLLKPMYLLMRSSDTSLWKIHYNNFLYTNTAQTSRLGPPLSISNKDLCISLFVSTCDNCEMNFFYQNNSVRRNLKFINPIMDNEWIETKLKEENIQLDKLDLFVETKFKDDTLNQTKGFWAIDDVRVCNENEVKVSFLKINGSLKENDAAEDIISCQLIKKPSWRPDKLKYNEIKEFPAIKSTRNATSITLTWNQEDPENQITYFVFYQGNDLCNTPLLQNLKRIKSNGFLSTKYNEIVIENLVPFTHYNITVSTVLHENDKELFVNTLETDDVTFEELPSKIQLQATDNVIHISWEKPTCGNTYGHLIHTLIVSNNELNFTKRLELQTENNYAISGLQPFTAYMLTVLTARNARNIHNGVHTNTININFTTSAGVAPSVQNLELYSIDENSASLRYDLPEDTHGVPSEIQVNRCNALSFKKCKSFVSRVTRCKLWPEKYCVDVNYLIPHQKYAFKLSIKNKDTRTFGKEAIVDGYAMDQVPGAPTNITYQVVDCQETTDYCHLNISWLHPYNQNGTITSFDIILNSTNKHVGTEEDKNIHELFKIVNKTYLPKYTYQIKYVPYSAVYNLYLQSANTKYRSDFATIPVKTDEIGDHIDQSPKLIGKSENALIFRLPYLDRRLKSYTLAVVVQDYDTNKTIPRKIMANKKIFDNKCHSFGETWISQVLKIDNNETETVTIGTGNSDKYKIKPDTKYCITFIITNRYKDSEHDVVYHEKLQTPSTPKTPKEASGSSQHHLYFLLLFLLLIPIGFLIYRYIRKRKPKSKPQETNENVYESLPFEECDVNAVSNDNYDHLLHK